jgi:hypothetical protein
MKPLSDITVALGRHLYFPHYFLWFNIEPSMLLLESVISEVHYINPSTVKFHNIKLSIWKPKKRQRKEHKISRTSRLSFRTKILLLSVL